MVDVGRILTDLQKGGRIGSVGVTNMDTEALAKLVDAGVPVVCNQVQFSLLDRRPLNGMIQYCKEHDIVSVPVQDIAARLRVLTSVRSPFLPPQKLLTYGTLAGGLLSERYVAEPKAGLPFVAPRYPPVDLNTSSLKMYSRNIGDQEGWRALLRTLQTIGRKHSVSIAAVALRWAMDAGPVHPIVGMRNATHIADNTAALKLQLDAADRAAIDEALRSCPGPAGDCYTAERS
jgi:aryl-alcohol dehydrogenase-like predicted oxidoreductase